MTELWHAAPRTEQAAAVHAAAESDRLAHPDRYHLEPGRVAAQAAGPDGDTTWFVPGWEQGLEEYLGSARDDGRLNALGARSVISTAVARLRSGAALRRHRDTAGGSDVAAPIVITGGWRTGTTFLFRLLATDQRFRAPFPAELAAPARVAASTPDEREAFLDAAAGAHEMLHVLNPELRAIHDSGARLPEECVLAMGGDLRNWGFTSTTRLDSYATWLATQDLGDVYVRYRHALEALDAGDGRRWVLKAPAHTAELPHLVAAFPGALVVQLHRDIVDTIASGASLFATFRSMYSDEVDAADVGRFQADQSALWFRRAVSFRSSADAVSARFVDVDYDRLVADPVGTIATIYGALEIDPPDDPARFVAEYRAAYPRHAHGTHRYTAASFGLDERALRDRFAFLDAFLDGVRS